MSEVVSKSQFKPRALEYFRKVEDQGRELIITDHNQPVIKIIPYQKEPHQVLRELRNSVRRYEQPLDPVAENDWEALQ
ncbi:MAG: type II toxin-antitoxin system Phd/YefM family antitoxin [Desulfuromonadales bacterium]|nr:type II toxin-antitoxin system Phd/YefM family antitoxin [Desulfuromonadales bacterium]